MSETTQTPVINELPAGLLKIISRVSNYKKEPLFKLDTPEEVFQTIAYEQHNLYIMYKIELLIIISDSIRNFDSYLHLNTSSKRSEKRSKCIFKFKKYSAQESMFKKALKTTYNEMAEKGFCCNFTDSDEDNLRIVFHKDYTEEEKKNITGENCYICMSEMNEFQILSTIGCYKHHVHQMCQKEFEKNYNEKTIKTYDEYHRCGVCKKSRAEAYNEKHGLPPPPPVVLHMFQDSDSDSDADSD